jgi:hypothetical protein
VLIVPQRYRHYREQVVPHIINSYAARVQKYFSADEVNELRQLAENIADKALGSEPDKFPSKSLCNVPSAEEDEVNDEGKAEFKCVDNEDTDMLAIASVEVEVENEQEVFYMVAPSKSSLTWINWRRHSMANCRIE